MVENEILWWSAQENTQVYIMGIEIMTINITRTHTNKLRRETSKYGSDIKIYKISKIDLLKSKKENNHGKIIVLST